MSDLMTRPRAVNGINWCQQPPRMPTISPSNLRQMPGVKQLVEERAGSRNAALKWRRRGFNAECRRNEDGSYSVYASWPA